MSEEIDKLKEKNMGNFFLRNKIERRTPEILEKLLILWNASSKQLRFQQFMFNLNENFVTEELNINYRFFDKETNQQSARSLFHIEDQLFEKYLDKLIERVENKG